MPGGVADHTLQVARGLHAAGAPVAVLAHEGSPGIFAPIPCVTGLAPGDVAGEAVRLGARTVLIEYVPFLWARRGVAPGLVLGIRAMVRANLDIAVFVHEPFVPFTRLPWLVTGIPQRLQFRYMVRRASHIYAAVRQFAETARAYAGPAPIVRIAPVGAAIAVSPLTRAAARAELGLADSDVAIGIFSPAASGFAHDWIEAAVRRLGALPGVRWVRFGHGSARALPGYPDGPSSITVGEASPERIAVTMRALDIAAAPYIDGLTMRRSGAMLALASGIPTVSSQGHLFDPQMASLAACEPDADAFARTLERLAADPVARAEVAARAMRYAELASTERLVAILRSDLEPAA